MSWPFSSQHKDASASAFVTAVCAVGLLLLWLWLRRWLASSYHVPVQKLFPRMTLSDLTSDADNEVRKESDLPRGWWTSEEHFKTEQRAIFAKVYFKMQSQIVLSPARLTIGTGTYSGGTYQCLVFSGVVLRRRPSVRLSAAAYTRQGPCRPMFPQCVSTPCLSRRLDQTQGQIPAPDLQVSRLDIRFERPAGQGAKVRACGGVQQG